VFSSDEEDYDGEKRGTQNENGRRRVDDASQRVVEVEIIDAETWEDEEGEEYDGDGRRRQRRQQQQQQQPSANDLFSNAWTGGPKPGAANGVAEGASAAATIDHEEMARRARGLLSRNPEIRAIVARARLDPRLHEAVRECEGDPSAFGKYLEDSNSEGEGGGGGLAPVLRELRDCI